MSPAARHIGAFCNPAQGKRLTTVITLACAALAVSGSQAFRPQNPDPGLTDRRRRSAAEQQPGERAHAGNVRHRHQHARMDCHLHRPFWRADRRPFPWPISYLGLTPEENAPIQVGTPGNLASPFHGVAQFSADQAKDLKDGRWYLNVHTKKFLAGEIRGPVVRE